MKKSKLSLDGPAPEAYDPAKKENESRFYYFLVEVYMKQFIVVATNICLSTHLKELDLVKYHNFIATNFHFLDLLDFTNFLILHVDLI